MDRTQIGLYDALEREDPDSLRVASLALKKFPASPLVRVLHAVALDRAGFGWEAVKQVEQFMSSDDEGVLRAAVLVLKRNGHFLKISQILKKSAKWAAAWLGGMGPAALQRTALEIKNKELIPASALGMIGPVTEQPEFQFALASISRLAAERSRKSFNCAILKSTLLGMAGDTNAAVKSLIEFDSPYLADGERGAILQELTDPVIADEQDVDFDSALSKFQKYSDSPSCMQMVREEISRLSVSERERLGGYLYGVWSKEQRIFVKLNAAKIISGFGLLNVSSSFADELFTQGMISDGEEDLTPGKQFLILSAIEYCKLGEFVPALTVLRFGEMRFKHSAHFALFCQLIGGFGKFNLKNLQNRTLSWIHGLGYGTGNVEDSVETISACKQFLNDCMFFTEKCIEVSSFHRLIEAKRSVDNCRKSVAWINAELEFNLSGIYWDEEYNVDNFLEWVDEKIPVFHLDADFSPLNFLAPDTAKSFARPKNKSAILHKIDVNEIPNFENWSFGRFLNLESLKQSDIEIRIGMLRLFQRMKDSKSFNQDLLIWKGMVSKSLVYDRYLYISQIFETHLKLTSENVEVSEIFGSLTISFEQENIQFHESLKDLFQIRSRYENLIAGVIGPLIVGLRTWNTLINKKSIHRKPFVTFAKSFANLPTISLKPEFKSENLGSKISEWLRADGKSISETVVNDLNAEWLRRENILKKRILYLSCIAKTIR